MNLLDNVILSIHKDFMEVEVKIDDKTEVMNVTNDLKLEEILEDIKYNGYWKFYQSKGGKNSRDVILEDKMAFMPFAYAYYFLLTTMRCVPTINELCDFYISTFCDEKEKGLYSFKQGFVFSRNNLYYQFDRVDLEAKICRAYNSYIRETALLNMFFDLQNERRYQDLEIFYDFHEDINGSDIVIKHKNKTFGILITQASKNSDMYNQKKRHHRHKYEYDDYLYAKLGEDQTFKCGDTDIFTKTFARNLLDQCLEKTA